MPLPLDSAPPEEQLVPLLVQRPSRMPHISQLATTAGPMLAAFTSRGLAALERGDDLLAFTEWVERRYPLDRRVADATDLAAQLDEYFAGERRSFDVRLDLSGLAPFDRRVLRAAVTVPYGETVTYGELAAQLGHPRAARAVGNALSRCPFTVVVPCHRIVRAADGLSGWGANLAEKRRLLDLERRYSQVNVRSPATPTSFTRD